VLRTTARAAPDEVLADRLCAAAADLLDIDGASLAALYDPTMSVPVGASDPAAAAAEQVQFTAGEGPCVFAQHTRALSVIADVGSLDDEGRRRWPTYAVLLMRATPFRSVIAVPVPVPVPPPGPRPGAAGGFQGAGTPASSWSVPLVLTCYRQQPLGAAATPAGESAGALGVAVRVASSLSAALGVVLSEAGAGASATTSAADAALASAPGSARGFAPGWLDSSTALVRATVWQAEEVLMLTREGLERDGALAALRTYAVVYALSVDEVASRLLAGRLRAAQVLGGG